MNRQPVFTATWIAVAFLTAIVIAGAPATNADSRGSNEPMELSIFFIGNSYTAAAGGQQHLVPRMLELKGTKVHTGQRIAARETLRGHLECNSGRLPRWREEQMAKNAKRADKSDEEIQRLIAEARAARIKGKGRLDQAVAKGAPWDYIVLQVGKGRGDPEKYELYPAVSELTKRFRETNPKSTIILYATWIPQDKPELQPKTDEYCRRAARENELRLAPAGTAMHRAHTERPGLKIFRTSTDSHPGIRGAYLIACVLYATITGESPVGLPAHLVIPTSYDFGDPKQQKTKKFSVSEADARFLQQLAWKTYLTSQQTMNERRFRN